MTDEDLKALRAKWEAMPPLGPMSTNPVEILDLIGALEQAHLLIDDMNDALEASNDSIDKYLAKVKHTEKLATALDAIQVAQGRGRHVTQARQPRHLRRNR